MAESHVVSALVNKRAEIAGMIARTKQQLGQFRADLVHLDATLRLFAPDLEPKTIPAKKFGKPISGSSKENCRAACSTCENAPNSDPIRVLCMPLINHVNSLASKGSGFARKRPRRNFIFSNEINTLGEFGSGVMIGGVFTASERKCCNKPVMPQRARNRNTFIGFLDPKLRQLSLPKSLILLHCTTISVLREAKLRRNQWQCG